MRLLAAYLGKFGRQMHILRSFIEKITLAVNYILHLPFWPNVWHCFHSDLICAEGSQRMLYSKAVKEQEMENNNRQLICFTDQTKRRKKWLKNVQSSKSKEPVRMCVSDVFFSGSASSSTSSCVYWTKTCPYSSVPVSSRTPNMLRPLFGGTAILLLDRSPSAQQERCSHLYALHF